MPDITVDNTGNITFSGYDAVALFRCVALAQGLRLYAKTKVKPNKDWTPTNMLAAATKFTGKPYKLGEYLKAADDLKVWANAMTSALEIKQR